MTGYWPETLSENTLNPTNPAGRYESTAKPDNSNGPK